VLTFVNGEPDKPSNRPSGPRMTILQALIHLASLLAPAVGLGLIAAALAKLLWRQALRGVPWRRLATAAVAAASLATVAGLVVLGRDGAMPTYAAMVAAATAALYWRGFVSPARGR
jgi:hypothetical protein